MQSEPALWELHHHTEEDWRRILHSGPEPAAAWVHFAAERGFRAAQVVLGQMYLDGHGVLRDTAAAYAWFERAAAIGSLDARNMLGRCHELGWGVPIDHAAALAHYRRAADRGHAWGRYNVGCLLLYGNVPRDHAQAFVCFTQAAEAGHAKASGMLGRCHEEGWGTPVNGVAAIDWYARAAEGGDAWGALNLGLIRAEAGAIAEAVSWLDRAIAMATPNCLAVIAETLIAHADPALSQIGQRAQAASFSILDAHGPDPDLAGAPSPTTELGRGKSKRWGAGLFLSLGLLLMVHRVRR